jgi:S1-C subfamily serine protease
VIAVRSVLALLLLLLGPVVPAPAAPRGGVERPDPRQLSPLPSYLSRVEPAIIGIRVEVPRDRPSAHTLGSERWGSGVIVDGAGGYALTVSYILLDAERIEVALRDGRRVPGRLVGLDLEVGIGVLKVDGPGPWPAAALGDSGRVKRGDVAGTLGVDDDGALVGTPGRVEAIRPFTAAWEYMLDRAFIVAPYNRAFGGAALVDAEGKVVGITSLRLGAAPHVNLAIPVEKFLPGKDELIARGRVTSRPPRPWIGLYTTADDSGVVVTGMAAAGPARTAGFRPGDVILRVNGEAVSTQEQFYARLWRVAVGEDVHLLVRRDSGSETIRVKAVDRYRVYRTTE